jgi:SAM-dependent methyltransferase
MNDPRPLDPFDAMLPAYAGWLQALAEPIGEILLDGSALADGSRVLDVCSTSGPVAVAAARRGYRVTGIEMSPITVTYLTGRLAPYADATAEMVDPRSMPYANDAFDAAFALFKIISLGPAAGGAFREVRRVVRPGGTVAVAHWATAAASPIHKIMVDACRDLADSGFPEPTVPIGYVKQPELVDLLTAAGLVDVRTEARSQDMALPAAEDFWVEMHSVLIAQPDVRALTPAQRARLEVALFDRVRRIEKGTEPKPRAEFNIAYARVPENEPTHP